MTACILSERRAVRPFGILGGGAALAGVNLLLTSDGRQVSLGGKNNVQLKGCERLRILTPGGVIPSHPITGHKQLPWICWGNILLGDFTSRNSCLSIVSRAPCRGALYVSLGSFPAAGCPWPFQARSGVGTDGSPFLCACRRWRLWKAGWRICRSS